MTEYLNYEFVDSPEFISTFDEMPLWSASFGLFLLKYLELKPNMTVLDIGSGAGFPLMELAQRLGSSCKCYGLDPWQTANARAKQKIINYNIKNVELIEASAATIPFEDESVDLIVSNLGINNFDEPDKVFAECHRVLKAGGRLALTTNIFGHWDEFYKAFEEALIQTDKTNLMDAVKHDQTRRGTVESISKLFTNNGLSIHRHFEESFEMKFLDGSAFLNHYFIKLGWLGSWKALIPEQDRITVFRQLETNLNNIASREGELRLTVPMAYIEGIKKS